MPWLRACGEARPCWLGPISRLSGCGTCAGWVRAWTRAAESSVRRARLPTWVWEALVSGVALTWRWLQERECVPLHLRGNGLYQLLHSKRSNEGMSARQTHLDLLLVAFQNLQVRPSQPLTCDRDGAIRNRTVAGSGTVLEAMAGGSPASASHPGPAPARPLRAGRAGCSWSAHCP